MGDIRHFLIPRDWEGETAFLLGGGPSLRGVDASILRDQRVITVNNAWELAPWAEYLHFADAKWWKRMRPKSDALAGYASNGDAVKAHFRGTVTTIADNFADPFVRNLRHAKRTVLSADPSALAHGSNSGAQAVNLAVLLGAFRIVLLGFDMRVDGERTHWHEGHGATPDVVNHRLTKNFVPNFRKLEQPLRDLGVEVIHGTPGSALDWWPYRPLTEILYENPNAKPLHYTHEGVIDVTT